MTLLATASQYEVKDGEANCVLDCPKKSGNCVAQTCCGPQQGKESPKISNGIFRQMNSTVASGVSTSSTPNLTVKAKTKSGSQNALNTVDFSDVTSSDREKSRSAEDMV